MTRFFVLSWIPSVMRRSGDVSIMEYNSAADAEVAITGCMEQQREWQFFVTQREISLEELGRELRADD